MSFRKWETVVVVESVCVYVCVRACVCVCVGGCGLGDNSWHPSIPTIGRQSLHSYVGSAGDSQKSIYLDKYFYQEKGTSPLKIRGQGEERGKNARTVALQSDQQHPRHARNIILGTEL